MQEEEDNVSSLPLAKRRQTSKEDRDARLSVTPFFPEEPASLGTMFLKWLSVEPNPFYTRGRLDTCLGSSLGVNYTRVWLKCISFCWIFRSTWLLGAKIPKVARASSLQGLCGRSAPTPWKQQWQRPKRSREAGGRHCRKGNNWRTETSGKQNKEQGVAKQVWLNFLCSA